MQGQDRWGNSQRLELWLVAYSVSRRQTLATLTLQACKEWDALTIADRSRADIASIHLMVI